MTRGRIAVLAAAVLVVAGLAVGGAAPAGPRPWPAGLAYGDTLVWMSDAELARALDDALAVGATWIRADLSWPDIQHDGPQQQRWELFDRVVRAAAVRDLTVLPVLAYTPPWARRAGCGEPACAPADPRGFAGFAAAAARRYAGAGIHTWEIWNEPNLGFWKPAPDPAGYADLLAAAGHAIRSVDPSARLVLGGLAATPTAPGRVSPADFLSAVLARGAGRYVDAVGCHPYTYPFLPSDRTEFRTAWESLADVRAVLDRAGLGAVPLWLTEVGAPTGGPGTASDGRPATITARTTHVTEERQAVIAADAVRTAAADPRIGALFWYSDRDLATAAPAADRDRDAAATANENFYGLRRADGTPKPAFAALRDALHAVAR